MTPEQRKHYHAQKTRAWKERKLAEMTPEERAEYTEKGYQYVQAWKKKHYADDAEYRRWRKTYRLMHRYGLTAEQVSALDAIKACPLCGIVFTTSILGDKARTGRIPVVDHIHGTKTVRGVICTVCNQLVGHVEKLSQNGDMEKLLSYAKQSPINVASLPPA
jgi:hypothetical protein